MLDIIAFAKDVNCMNRPFTFQDISINFTEERELRMTLLYVMDKNVNCVA